MNGRKNTHLKENLDEFLIRFLILMILAANLVTLYQTGFGNDAS